MLLREWFRRRRRQAQARARVGSGKPPVDDYGPSTALHATIAMNTLFSTDTVRAPPSESMELRDD